MSNRVYFNNDWLFTDSFEDSFMAEECDTSAFTGVRLPHTVKVTPFNYFDESEYACVSSDEGQTWDVEHEIFLSAHTDGDLGYPSTVQLANGDLLTVYYQPVKSHEPPCLMATKWRLKINL